MINERDVIHRQGIALNELQQMRNRVELEVKDLLDYFRAYNGDRLPLKTTTPKIRSMQALLEEVRNVKGRIDTLLNSKNPLTS